MATQPHAYTPNFKPQKLKFILLNSTPEEIVLRWAGLQLTLPPSDQVGHRPGAFDDGEKIPGSYLIEDAYTFNADGTIPAAGSPHNWLATEAIRNLLGINPRTGEAISPFAMKGISVVAEEPTREIVAEVQKDGMKRFEQFLWDWANETVTGYEVARDKASAAGVNARPPGRDYDRAMRILQGTSGQSREVVEEAADEKFLQQEAELRIMALEMAEQAAKGREVDKAELADQLLADPQVKQHLKRKWSIRKRGHLPEKEEAKA
jgi:hypothetical protein